MLIVLYNDIVIVVVYEVFVILLLRDVIDFFRNIVYIVVNVWDEILVVFNFVVFVVVVIRVVEVLLKFVLFFFVLFVNVVKEDDLICVEIVEFFLLDVVFVFGFLVVFIVNGIFIVGY